MNINLLIAAGALSLAAATPGALAEDLAFTLKNATGSTLTHFYSSPFGVNDWEVDVFGENVPEPGESMDITIADGRDVCTYDMRFEFADGSNLDTTEDTRDLCKLGSYTIHE